MEIIEKIKKDHGIKDLKKEFNEEKLVLGIRETLKLTKKNKIERIYLSTTAPKYIVNREEFKKVEINRLDIDAVGLGKLLGKNFPVSVAGVLK
ncbi:MAG TPA: hypothetical protein ENF39_00495 [Candidatus Aenigmarchaeota archaeon]|nr:hypothetical protein [Candidatus Aenigmarchaeota archaeon]